MAPKGSELFIWDWGLFIACSHHRARNIPLSDISLLLQSLPNALSWCACFTSLLKSFPSLIFAQISLFQTISIYFSPIPSLAALQQKGLKEQKTILRLLFSHLITFITTQFWGKQDQDKSWRREEGWALTGWGQVNLQVHTYTSSPEHLTDKSWSPLHTITWLSRFSLLSATSLIFFIIFAASFFTSSDRKGQINLMCPKQSKQRPILGIIGKIYLNWLNFSLMKLKLHPLFLVHSICLKTHLLLPHWKPFLALLRLPSWAGRHLQESWIRQPHICAEKKNFFQL